jgi:hypothetical protein
MMLYLNKNMIICVTGWAIRFITQVTDCDIINICLE